MAAKKPKKKKPVGRPKSGKSKSVGRPKSLTKKQLEKVIIEVQVSTDGLTKICKSLGFTSRQFYRRIDQDKELSLKYTRAKERQADLIFHSMIEDVESCLPDKNEINKKRLEIDTKKWILAHLKPSRYSDKVEINQTQSSETRLTIDFSGTSTEDIKKIKAMKAKDRRKGIKCKQPPK